jgi:hypothetical protein
VGCRLRRCWWGAASAAAGGRGCALRFSLQLATAPESCLLTIFGMFVLPVCMQAGIDYEYESLEAALPKKSKKTTFED